MRRFMINTLPSSFPYRAAFLRRLSGGYDFSGNPTSTVSNTNEDDRHKTVWLMKTHKHGRFMSTLTNPLATSVSDNESNIKVKETRIKVISKEDIKPSSPTPENLRHYNLSMFDQIEHPIYHPFMFFYPNTSHHNNTEQIISDRSNCLKQSLSQTLTRIYPFAGKLANELHIDCNDEGVYYVETRIEDRLDNVLKKPDNKFLKRLIPPNQPFSGCYVSMVQVNFFNCGGVCITVQHSHKLADARSSMMFMNTWAAIAKQDPNHQIYPDFRSSSMFPQNPNLPFSPCIPLWYLTVSPANIKSSKPETKRFGFDAFSLRELKAKASKHQPVSRVVAVLTFLLKCVSVETRYKPSTLHMPVDIRRKFSPPLPQSSIGNVISKVAMRFNHPDASEEGELELASMASRLQNEIAGITSESVEELKRENGHVRFLEGVRNSMEMLTDYRTEYYMASSLCNSGSREVDFGWGKPVWCCTGNHLNDDVPLFTNRMILMDSCSGDGIEAWVTLEKQVMDGVRCNGELLSYAAVDPSPL